MRMNSAHADLLPSSSDFASHPIDSVGMVFEVLRLDAEMRSAETGAKRTREVDDVERRARYRKAHGLPAEQGIASWLPNGGKAVEPPVVEEVPVEGGKAEGGKVVAGEDGGVVGRDDAVVADPVPEARKKWFGVF